ncbi:MAG: hypothetical protein RDV48_12745 [Candidatus Eremiobacteraeota bacterium]|nr:hypothetical protein [Candidatus Eremiobacteraeota bacterium]
MMHRQGNHAGRGPRGFALASLLMLMCVVLILSVSMAGFSCFQLNIALKVESDARARMAARSELSRALMKFISEANFGLDGSPDSWTDNFTGASARIIFAPGDIPHSTYNYFGTTSIPGWQGKTVPAESIRLIATGAYASSARSIEMIVKKGTFPYALATSSKIQSVNAPLWTEGTKTAEGFLEGAKDYPGNIASNYAGGGNAIEAPKGSFVTGKVSAPGAIDIKMPSVVLGGICTGSQPVELPFITVDSLDPQGQIGIIELTETSINGMAMDTVYRAQGKLTVYGDLSLDNALLFAGDDLVITGKVEGAGTLISKGAITIGNASTLAASNRLAVVAEKDITVAGQGSYLQGMIYTHGNFYGENFTLVGNLIAQSSEETKGNVILKDVTLVSNQETTEMTSTSPLYSGDAGNNLWHNQIVEQQYANSICREHFDIQYKNITSLAGLKSALTAAAADFNVTTAAALDQHATLSFHIICNTNGTLYDHEKFSSMTAMAQRLQQDGFGGYLSSYSGATTIPAEVNLQKVIRGLLLNILHKLDRHPENASGSGYHAVTELKLNKYVTNVYPTKIVFQGELP